MYTNAVKDLISFHYFIISIAAKRAVDVGLPIGLHLNLTEGITLSGKDSTLCDPITLVMRGKAGFREAWKNGKIHPDHVINEVKAQMEKFRELVGAYPVHFDGHQHVHVIPSIASLIAPSLSELGVSYTRMTAEVLEMWPWMSEHPSLPFYKEVSEQGNLSRRIYANYGIIAPTTCVGLSVMGLNLTLDRLVNLVRFYMPVR